MLLANLKRSQPALSPDGTRIAYLAPNERDALQIWVRTLGQTDDRCVTAARRSIQNYKWGWDSNLILYAQDNDGDENDHICAVDLQTGNARDLTPWQGVRCQNTMTSAKRPGEILAVLNVRDRKLMDVWRIDLRTGAAALEVENPGNVEKWVADDDLVVCAARVRTPDDGFKFMCAPNTLGRGGRSSAPRPMNGYFRWASTRMGATSSSFHRSEATPSEWSRARSSRVLRV